jgi:choline monooxygenase
VQSVQRGIRSRAYRSGRYLPQHERGVHHFHRLLAQALA